MRISTTNFQENNNIAMNVFLVDAGKLFALDQSVISKRVQDLQVILSDLADIPLDKQVRNNISYSVIYDYETPHFLICCSICGKFLRFSPEARIPYSVRNVIYFVSSYH